ncbi:MAG: CoA transferase [Deltaproteobacteria bacterium]|nr:CoA transferase [Deltaproteobacteria bacterium]
MSISNITESTERRPDTAPLSGIRVVEGGQGVSAAFATKLMALLGAQILKVEPSQGDVVRRRGPFFQDKFDAEESGLFLYLNADKQSVTLDLETADGRTHFDRLLDGADVLVHNILPVERTALRMASSTICADHPNLVVTAISPFGETGPRALYRAYDINVVHAGGVASVAPLCSSSPELPPLKLFGQQSEFQAGVHAAFATLAAIFHRVKNGGGQAVEVSAQECLAAMLELSFVAFTYGGVQTSRLGRRLLGPWGMFDCRDGRILMCCVEEHQWLRLIALMGHPEWVHEELFKDRFARGRNWDALSLLIGDWTKDWTVKDLFHTAQQHRIPVAPVNRIIDVYADDHLREREFLAPLPLPDGRRSVPVPAFPFKSSTMRWRFERPAPHLNEHNSLRDKLERRHGDSARVGHEVGGRDVGPLSGVRVLDFTWVWQGPFCTLQLAHLGAEILRVESIRRLDINRAIPPFAEKQEGRNRAGSFNQWNQGKRSIRLNLEMPEAVAIAKSLVTHCDLVVENFAPGVMARIGLGYEMLRELKPDIIMVSLSGYGQTGPYSRFVSYGGLLGAQSGLFSVSGYEPGQPCETGITYGDPNSGAFGTYATIAALIHRARTGEGQHIDVSLWETLEMVLPEAWLEFAMNGREPQARGNRDPWMVPHNCYKSRGDAEQWVSIAVGSEREWRALCEVIGQPALACDPRFSTAVLRKQHEDELDAIITQWTSDRDRWEVTEMLQRAGVAAMPTLSNRDLALDPHLRQRAFLVELDHPEVGRRAHTGIPWTMSGTPCKVHNPAPVFGADTDRVLMELLGYSGARIEMLRHAGVLT